MRDLVLGALVGSLLLLAPLQATAPAVPGRTGDEPVRSAQGGGPLDNSSEPGAVFPTGPFAGGTG